jgi:type IV pilus assembly protein PilV
MRIPTSRRRQSGTSLLEVLITMLVLAVGLLGLAAFQAKAQVGSVEAYQRAQAVVLLEDMRARMRGNPDQAANYVTTTALGAGTPLADCSTLAVGSARDLCEWNVALQGSAEQKDANQLGAMQDARGCIETVQAPDPSKGVCRPGTYLISVAWQGMHKTQAPALACGKDAYGVDSNRRAISLRVAIGLPGCS